MGGSNVGLALLVVAFVLLLLAKMAKDVLTPYAIEEEVAGQGNLAVAVSLSGYLLATVLVLLGAALGPSHGLVEDVTTLFVWGLGGIVGLNLSRWVNDHAILSSFDNAKEVAGDRNVGTGAVEFGSYVASGLIVAGAIHGEGGGVETALAFFGLGQLTLIVFARVYDLVTSFDLHAEIERDNVAAGVAFGGNLTAFGILLMNGSSGSFVSWPHNLAAFGAYALVGIVVLPIVRLGFDRFVLPSVRVDTAIREQRNVAVGLLEMTVTVGFAVLFAALVDLDPFVTAWVG